MSNPKVDPTIKTKWIEALRSGTYDQCTTVLRSGTGFCCLGVLADITGAEWIDQDPEEYEYEYIARIGDNTYDQMPPEGLGGLDMAAFDRLATMNDSGKTFAEIADVIEQEY